MKYLLLILLFPVLAHANLRDTVPQGVPQLFGAKYYKFNAYVLVDSFIMNAPGDTNNVPYFPSLKFKSTDNRWYGYDRSTWQRFLYASDTSTLLATQYDLNSLIYNNGLSKDGDSTKLGQNVGQSGDPAAFHMNREIPLNGFDLRFKNIGRNNSGILKLYKDPTKAINVPFVQLRDQRDTLLINMGADSLLNEYYGYGSGQALTTGSANTFFGYKTGLFVTTGIRNTLMGESAGGNISTGSRNTAFGVRGLRDCTTGQENTAVNAAFPSVTTGSNNIGLGYLSAVSMTTGNFNIAIGGSGILASPLQQNSTGSYNIALGTETLAGGPNFNSVIGIGHGTALNGATQDYGIYIGDHAHTRGTRGYGNIVLGALALTNPTNIGDTNVIISPFATSVGASLLNNNIVLGPNWHTTATNLSNSVTLGAGMTNNVNNVVRVGRSDQNVILGSTANITDKGYRLQVLGAGYISDSIKIDNIPNGAVTDSLLVKRNNVVYTIAHTELSGTYTPTLTNVTNIDSSKAYPCQYMRVGNTVTVSGKVDIGPTAAAATTLGISLPIASAFANDYQAGGTASAGIELFAGSIRADATNDRVQIDFVIPAAGSTSNTSWFFSFTYQIL